MDPLFHQKGSDASWENDQEPPEHCLDYSDDEQERKAKAALKNKKRSRPESNSDQGTNEHKKFQPRTQQNLRGRGRQRGAHHHHQRQPANPFYMSLSSNYSAGEYVLPTAAEMSRLVSNEGAAESTISNQPEILVQTDLTSANCENTTDIRPLNEPLSTSTCRSKSKDEAVSGEKSSVVDLESSSSGRENNAEPNRSIQYEPNDNANSSQNNQAEIKESCASDHQPV